VLPNGELPRNRDHILIDVQGCPHRMMLPHHRITGGLPASIIRPPGNRANRFALTSVGCVGSLGLAIWAKTHVVVVPAEAHAWRHSKSWPHPRRLPELLTMRRETPKDPRHDRSLSGERRAALALLDGRRGSFSFRFSRQLDGVIIPRKGQAEPATT
jgi:hypothetical protein